MKLSKREVLFIVVSLISIALLVLFSVLNFNDDYITNVLIKDTITRLILVAYLIFLLLLNDKSVFKFHITFMDFLWSIPIFLVALANFPFSALINGSATILRTELLALFIIDTFLVALTEELFFRGFIHKLVLNSKKIKKYIFKIIVSSSFFALSHLLNLLYGAGILDTLMQVGYSFLIGCMLAVMYDKTKNIYFGVMTHFIFNIGGNIIFYLGSGNPHDLIFWILTISFGVICAIHVIIRIYRVDHPKDDDYRYA